VSRQRSASTGTNYGISLVCRIWEIARSTVYHRKKRCLEPATGRRGSRPVLSDSDLLEEIKAVLDPSSGDSFHGEGYRKVLARLRFKGIPASKDRVARIMRENELRSPVRPKRVSGPRSHDGKITTDRPDEMWGTDMTGVFVEECGNVAIFLAADHCNSELIGLHASINANRSEAFEPIRQGIRAHFGSYEKGVAAGLKIRHDHGSQYLSRYFQGELRFIGAESSPSFIRAPEGNGVAERMVRTLKEQCLWLRRWKTLEELQAALVEFKERYNRGWLVQKHGYKTPLEIRRRMMKLAA